MRVRLSAKVKTTKSRKRNSRLSGVLVFATAVFMCVIMAGRFHKLNQTSKELDNEINALNVKIAEATVEQENLASREAYMRTTSYIEDVAKDKLNLVYPDEIVIKPQE